MKKTFVLKKLLFSFLILTLLSECGIYRKTDSRKVPYNVNDRVQKNLEEGRGFRLDNTIDKIRGKGQGGSFEFASSNELWRASLDTIDFMPLTSANYSGGIIITDWYSDNSNNNQSIKIIIRFLIFINFYQSNASY